MKLTLPQIELIAAAAGRKLWRHRDQDYTAGTNSHLNVTKRVAALYNRALLVRGEDRNLGWLWRPTETARAEALAELDAQRQRLGWLRRDLDPTAGEDD